MKPDSDLACSSAAINRRTALKQFSSVLGGAVFLPIATGFLAGCSQENHEATGEWQARVLSYDQNAVITVIAERIIPQTDTPGASAAKVNEFIDLIIDGWFSEVEKHSFFEGLKGAEALSEDLYNKHFLACSEAEQVNLLLRMEEEYLSQAVSPSPRAEFFNLMKQFTLIGYYTSEVGATQELRMPAMGQYLGCESFDESGVAWAW